MRCSGSADPARAWPQRPALVAPAQGVRLDWRDFDAAVTRLARNETAANAKFPPERIGRLLRLLIPLQALLGFAAVHRFPANLVGLLLLPLLPLHGRWSRRFPPS